MSKITVVVVKKENKNKQGNRQLIEYLKEKVVRERMKNEEKDFSVRENKQG